MSRLALRPGTALRLAGVLCVLMLLPMPAARAQAGDEGSAQPRVSFREAIRTFASDGGYLFTFPRRVTARGAWSTAAFAAGTFVLIDQDDEIRSRVLSADRAWADDAASVFEPLGRSYVEAAALGLGYWAGRASDRPALASTAATAFEAWLWTFLITTGAKAASGRQPPTGDYKAHDFFDGGTIFPSGHTSRSFAIAAVLADRHGRAAAWIAYPAAALIGLSTVQQDTHWTSDILAGAGLGLAIGKGIAHRHPRHGDIGAAAAGRAASTWIGTRRAAWCIVPAREGARILIVF